MPSRRRMTFQRSLYCIITYLLSKIKLYRIFRQTRNAPDLNLIYGFLYIACTMAFDIPCTYLGFRLDRALAVYPQAVNPPYENPPTAAFDRVDGLFANIFGD